MLHLMGYDHVKPEEAQQMERRQAEILEQLEIKKIKREENMKRLKIAILMIAVTAMLAGCKKRLRQRLSPLQQQRLRQSPRL